MGVFLPSCELHQISRRCLVIQHYVLSSSTNVGWYQTKELLKVSGAKKYYKANNHLSFAVVINNRSQVFFCKELMIPLDQVNSCTA